MATSVKRAGPGPGRGAGVSFRPRERWVLLVASVWLVVGLQLDAYAHATTPELETFWTPWHGVLYSGIAASGFTLLWLLRPRLPAIPTYRSLLALPNALRIPLIGMALLLVGGGVDTLWHNLFGIEQDLEIFVSPSHELIIVGMVLVAAGPALMLATEPGRTLSFAGRHAGHDLGAVLRAAPAHLLAARLGAQLPLLRQRDRPRPGRDLLAGRPGDARLPVQHRPVAAAHPDHGTAVAAADRGADRAGGGAGHGDAPDVRHRGPVVAGLRGGRRRGRRRGAAADRRALRAGARGGRAGPSPASSRRRWSGARCWRSARPRTG